MKLKTLLKFTFFLYYASYKQQIIHKVAQLYGIPGWQLCPIHSITHPYKQLEIRYIYYYITTLCQDLFTSNLDDLLRLYLPRVYLYLYVQL